MDLMSLNHEAAEIYFHEVIQAFGIMQKVYDERTEKGHMEGRIVGAYLEKMLWTLMTLRMRHRFEREKAPPKIDPQDSGFVQFYEISRLETDLAMRTSRLAEAASARSIKADMLDFMLRNHKEPVEHLQRMGRRRYLEMLDEKRLFLQFNNGFPTKMPSQADTDLHMFYWAIYDAASNRPYIHIMLYEQSFGTPLEQDDAAFRKFLEVIKGEGSRAPNLNILAAAIDDRLENIHPKVLKRICLGPFYTEAYAGELPAHVKALFQHGEEGERFALFLEHEQVFSKHQIVTSSMFGKDKMREIYFVPSDVSALYERGISSTTRFALLPHRLHQHASQLFAKEAQRTLISFDSQGALHGI